MWTLASWQINHWTTQSDLNSSLAEVLYKHSELWRSVTIRSANQAWCHCFITPWQTFVLWRSLLPHSHFFKSPRCHQARSCSCCSWLPVLCVLLVSPPVHRYLLGRQWPHWSMWCAGFPSAWALVWMHLSSLQNCENLEPQHFCQVVQNLLVMAEFREGSGGMYRYPGTVQTLFPYETG